jgi:hypothetical protein
MLRRCQKHEASPAQNTPVGRNKYREREKTQKITRERKIRANTHKREVEMHECRDRDSMYTCIYTAG